MLSDCAYDTNDILSHLGEPNIKPVIPPNYNCVYQRDYERQLHCLRYIIENDLLALKR